MRCPYRALGSWCHRSKCMIEIKPVVRDDVETLFALRVAPEQTDFVAPNALTLAEFAHIAGGYVFTIWSDGLAVGLMGLIDLREHDELEEGDDPEAVFLMRMMIAEEHQRQGIGQAAMERALAWARERGNTCFQTSVVPGNMGAEAFYHAVGLRRTGRMVEGEIEMSVGLR